MNKTHIAERTVVSQLRFASFVVLLVILMFLGAQVGAFLGYGFVVLIHDLDSCPVASFPFWCIETAMALETNRYFRLDNVLRDPFLMTTAMIGCAITTFVFTSRVLRRRRRRHSRSR